MTYTVRRLSEKEFFGLQESWDHLLEQSNADPLFMSWAWQASWWETWGDRLNLDLLLLGVYAPGDTLVGLAPLYLSAVSTPLGWKVRRLHVVGNAWKLGPTVRTEYVGVIADRREQQAILQALGSYLAEVRWDEMIIADASARSRSMIESGLSQTLALSRVVRSESEGVVIPTQGQFTDWLSRLGKNTRLKAYNRRELFEGTLNGSFEEWQTPETFLALLNRFHCERWGKPCFDDNAVRFHEALLNRLSGSQSARMSVLRADNQIVSVLYDVRAGYRVYNLQAGFMQDFHNKLSLGTLHLGYAIERSFQDSSIVSYDLLAGSGKNTFYKQHFRGEQVLFTTVEYVRAPILKMAYGARGCMPPRLVSSINRFFRL